MITAQELESIPIFACLEENERQRFAERAADVKLAAGEWLVREGETAHFFVLLDGEMKVVKEILGQQQAIAEYKPGSFFGEIPVLLLAPSFASVKAKTHARVARFDPQLLFELIHTSEKCSAVILQTMTDRLSGVGEFVRETPSARVLIIGTQYDEDCREIRAFLSANRIPYEWIDQARDADRVPVCMLDRSGEPILSPAIVVDRESCVKVPTVRNVAEALGINTKPKQQEYDVVVVGAGPAGLAAGVYGASEGLKVLIVEKSACGGQAGTSSRIENYLGFPNGVSGDELADKALKQAQRFGAEIAMTRTVESMFLLENGRHCIELDGGDRVTSSAVVLATGVEWRRLDAEGVDQFRGRGVYYGASRDETVNIMGKKIFIVGGGNSAGQAAMYFSHYASDVIVLVRGEGLTLTMSQYLIDQLGKQKNIKISPYTEVIRAEGEDHLERVTFRKRVPGEAEVIVTKDVDALFVMIGAKANTAWLPKELQRNSAGYICTGRDLTTWREAARPAFPLETNLPGVFCAGDVRAESIKRVSSGVGEGSMAIAFVHQYLALESRG
ncbi:cyclic nucleotide-binding domain-containing protein [Granulicella sp. 5B5]|uniref:FAD-dependent oxidoreductase n=1 Tax=Granulicella sp. 5B5 TaxID=1617967 RepID=UPI0015F43D92|nr:FAD-dependent oxidoreductase [Granulicella sp. 5B5]QMV17724.1 cyclic nucleotide-binding domain-containing protein [Granulicella sp. 5B5]